MRSSPHCIRPRMSSNSKRFIGAGLAFGVAIGTGVGVALHNIGAGLAIGISLGVALGAARSRRG